MALLMALGLPRIWKESHFGEGYDWQGVGQEEDAGDRRD